MPPQNTIQLSMIVTITSCVPTVALSRPAMPASIAPASEPTTSASRMCSTLGMPSSEEPTHTPAIAPSMY